MVEPRRFVPALGGSAWGSPSMGGGFTLTDTRGVEIRNTNHEAHEHHHSQQHRRKPQQELSGADISRTPGVEAAR